VCVEAQYNPFHAWSSRKLCRSRCNGFKVEEGPLDWLGSLSVRNWLMEQGEPLHRERSRSGAFCRAKRFSRRFPAPGSLFLIPGMGFAKDTDNPEPPLKNRG